jgi:hypothetical protein
MPKHLDARRPMTTSFDDLALSAQRAIDHFIRYHDTA